MNWHQSIRLTLISGAALVAIALLSLTLCWLLSSLGDETGATAAQMVSTWAIIGAVLVQILLVNLLALRSLGVKIEGER